MTVPETDPTPATDGLRLPAGRRWAVRVLLIGATIVAIVAALAVWANRQVLDADNWADTSTALLADQEIRGQVSAFLVDQLYTDVDVRGEVASALPARLQPLAGPAANGLRDLAQRATAEALGRPRFQEVWRAANRVTAQQFINIAEGRTGAITASGDAVVLDLRVMLLDLTRRLGLPGTLASRIPAGGARVKIMSSDQITTVQSVANALKGLGIALPAIAVIGLALAVFLARGRRRRTLLVAGIDFALAGAVVLVARNVIGNHVVDALATTDAVRPAVTSAWDIGTRLLRDIGQAMILAALPVVAGAMLAGPLHPAVAARRLAAPWLRDRPDLAYAALALVLLLIIAWGPIPATREVIPMLVIIVLAAVGLEALRRQTAREFPEARAGDGRIAFGATAQRARAFVAHRGGDGHRDGGRVDQLERLAALHAQGALSDEEFAAEKSTLGSR